MLTLLTQESQYQAALQRAKAGARAFSMNVFAGPEAMQRWMAQGRLELLEAGGAALILRRDRECQRLYHAAPDRAALAEALAALARERPEAVIATDLVGRREDVSALAECHAVHGFYPHTKLFRMAAPGAPLLAGSGELPDVVHAGPKDAPELRAFLEARLDPLAERPPEEEELRLSCERREVLCCRKDGALAGVLLMALSGYTAQLSYWFVDGRFQGLGVGSRLIRSFFRACAGSRRILLWVIAGNEGAIAKYGHYGFKADGLMDQVMVRGPRER